MKIVLGVLLIIVGILAALFFNVYLLITGIIDIVHGSSIIGGILKIAFREIIGGIVAFIFIGTGAYTISKSK